MCIRDRYCSACKNHVRATKKMSLYKSSQYLLLHLKRFKSGGHILSKQKNSALVDFPHELDMTPYVLHKEKPNEFLNETDTKIHTEDEKIIYELVAISNHYGEMGFGHYTAYVKNMHTEKWYCCDDSSVREISPDGVVTKAAYVLFYKRKEK
eukprot:TRINITY_DN6769_c0_g3_i2.p1 TRINITY_DN6769_c0_g3~~TRINITY_DN6769_c0_g3_i2.p1  ORF type:complete len:152 (+),score=36.99 TRINITY_DN6769_c0_g3_i2:65-520(+)